jgi:flagellar motility protein MotE (MotC chaperone)
VKVIDHLRTPRVWKALLAVKLTALAVIWLLVNGGLQLGDRDIVAAEEKKDGDKAKAADVAADAPAAADHAGEAAKPAAPKDEGKSKTRKSFLSNLLELPELNPEGAQKEELGKYLEMAERKKRQIEERLDLLRKREDQLKGLEHTIDDKLKSLDEERHFFGQTVQQEKDLKGERLDKLVAMYAKMEPKKAAPVMEKLDKDLVVALFKAMPQKQVTAMLEAMSPDKATQISEYYGRVRSTREYDVLKEMNQSLRKEFDDCKGLPKTAE